MASATLGSKFLCFVVEFVLLIPAISKSFTWTCISIPFPLVFYAIVVLRKEIDPQKLSLFLPEEQYDRVSDKDDIDENLDRTITSEIPKADFRSIGSLEHLIGTNTKNNHGLPNVLLYIPQQICWRNEDEGLVLHLQNPRNSEEYNVEREPDIGNHQLDSRKENCDLNLTKGLVALIAENSFRSSNENNIAAESETSTHQLRSNKENAKLGLLPKMVALLLEYFHRSRDEDNIETNKNDDENATSIEVKEVLERLGLPYDPEGGELDTDITDVFESSEPTLDELRDAFEVFDQNRDGFLDPEELQRVLCLLGMTEGVNLENCRRMIQNVSRSGRERLDLCDFIRVMESILC